MPQTGKAVKVSIYVQEGSRMARTDVASRLLDFLFKNGVGGATVIKGVAGYGSDHHLHTTSILSLSDHLPIKVEFIESKEMADSLLPQLAEMAGTGLIEVQETFVYKAAGHTHAEPKAQTA